jgi:ABC-2 type transport system permease protein
MHFLRITLLFWRTYLLRVLFTKRFGIVLLGCMVVPFVAWLLLTAPRHGPTPAEAFLYPSYFLLLQFYVPLASVIAGSAVISEEIDDRTITYLLTRPIPRATILIGRWLATLTILFVFTAGTVTALRVVVESKAQTWKPGESFTVEWKDRRTGEQKSRVIEHEFEPALFEATKDGKLPEGLYAALLTAACVGVAVYSALFACLGTFNKHPMIVGLGYCFAIEGFLANLPGTSQSWTVQYYLRSYLLSNHKELWSLLNDVELVQFETARAALVTLGVVLLVALTIGSIVISRRQYVLSA